MIFYFPIYPPFGGPGTRTKIQPLVGHGSLRCCSFRPFFRLCIPNRIPRTQRVRPNLPMPDPALLIEPAQPVHEVLIPAIARPHALEPRVRHDAHRPAATMRRGIDHEFRTWRERVLVWVEGEGLREQGEVVVAGGCGSRGGGGGTAAAEGAADEGEAGRGPAGAVFGDEGGAGEVLV